MSANFASSDDEYDFEDYVQRIRRRPTLPRQNAFRVSPTRERSPVQRVTTWQDNFPSSLTPAEYFLSRALLPSSFGTFQQMTSSQQPRCSSPMLGRLSPPSFFDSQHYADFDTDVASSDDDSVLGVD